MLKKPLLKIVLAGVLLIVAGLILSPSFVGKLTADGKITTTRGIVGTNLFQFYLITLGVVIILEYLIIGFLFPKEWISNQKKRISLYLLGVCFIGLVIIITGIIFNPSFIERELNFFIVDETRFSLLNKIQFAIITFGCLIVFLSFFIYRKKFLQKKKFGSVILFIILLIYIVLADITYINQEYPSNILIKPGEYGKVINLMLGKDILLSEFSPRPTLKVHRTKILKAKFPVIDVHFHINSPFMSEQDKKIVSPEFLIKSMDSVGLKAIVCFDITDNNFDYFFNKYQKKYPGRFLIFSDMFSIQGRMVTKEFFAKLPERLEKINKKGMVGIGEFIKDLGLKMKDETGKLIPIDDTRLDPFYDKAGELGMPFIWHTADPTSFWYPVNKYNERFIELSRYPFWSYVGLTPKDTLLKQLENVLKKHPRTIVIGAHMDWLADDLTRLEKLLDTYPNYYVEFGSTLSELGRQPYTARRFFIKYQDRILFGTDGGSMHTKGWTIEKFYRASFEFLETDNEYFEYPNQGAIDQGDWKIYGIKLPDEVLEKIYYKNAEKILFKNYKD